jgi:DnaJ-class molecular chaperone
VSADLQSGPCHACGGAGGTVETDETDGVFRQTWHPCTDCNGDQQ